MNSRLGHDPGGDPDREAGDLPGGDRPSAGRGQPLRRGPEGRGDAPRPRSSTAASRSGPQYVIEHANRDGLAAHLKAQGMPTAVYYPMPMRVQAPYADFPRRAGGLPVTEAKAETVLALPMHPYLSQADQQRIIDCHPGLQRRGRAVADEVLEGKVCLASGRPCPAHRWPVASRARRRFGVPAVKKASYHPVPSSTRLACDPGAPSQHGALASSSP